MGKRTINAKEILVNIKAGMNDAALMEKHGLLGKGLQSVFKKLVEGVAWKNLELGRQMSSLERDTRNRENHKEYLNAMEAFFALTRG